MQPVFKVQILARKWLVLVRWRMFLQAVIEESPGLVAGKNPSDNLFSKCESSLVSLRSSRSVCCGLTHRRWRRQGFHFRICIPVKCQPANLAHTESLATRADSGFTPINCALPPISLSLFPGDQPFFSRHDFAVFDATDGFGFRHNVLLRFY